jgi:hypothetical protein
VDKLRLSGTSYANLVFTVGHVGCTARNTSWYELRFGTDCMSAMICVDCGFDLFSFTSTTHYFVSVLMASGLIIMLIVVVLNAFGGLSHCMYGHGS